MIIGGPTALAQTDDQRVLCVLDRMQQEMSVCIAYQIVVAGCVDRQSSATARARADYLIAFASTLGATVGLTQEALLARIEHAGRQIKETISGDCGRVDSLHHSYGERCQQVAQLGNDVLAEFHANECARQFGGVDSNHDPLALKLVAGDGGRGNRVPSRHRSGSRWP